MAPTLSLKSTSLIGALRGHTHADVTLDGWTRLDERTLSSSLLLYHIHQQIYGTTISNGQGVSYECDCVRRDYTEAKLSAVHSSIFSYTSYEAKAYRRTLQVIECSS